MRFALQAERDEGVTRGRESDGDVTADGTGGTVYRESVDGGALVSIVYIEYGLPL